MRFRYPISKTLAQRRHLQITKKRCLALSYNIHDGKDTTQPPLLMIHGLLGNKNNFNTITKLLREEMLNRTIISCDVRNHGESPHSNVMDYPAMTEDTLELLQKLKIDKCTVLGHSLGGRIAMHIALTEGSKVDKVIVVDVAPRIDEERRSIDSNVIQFLEAMKQTKFQPGMTRSQARSDADKQLMEAIPDKGIRDYILTNVSKMQSGSFGWRVNLDVFLKNLKDLGHIGSHEELLTPYNGDTMFLCGGLSTYVPSDDIPDIKRWFPTAVIKYLPDCGHWVHSDNPRLFSENVAAFLTN